MRHRRPLLHVAAVALATTAALGASACSTAEPHRDLPYDQVRPVSIAVEEDSLGQQVMGEIYAQALADSERGVSVNMIATEADYGQVDALRATAADLIIGCTGDLLGEVNPLRAEEILAEAESESEEEGEGDDANPNAAALDVEVYESLMRSLPSSITATDQSGAQACPDTETPGLPQNIVPVFGHAVFDRDELGLLDIFTKLITTQELAELVEEAERTSSVEQVVTEWMGTAESESGSSANQDSDSGEEEGGFGFNFGQRRTLEGQHSTQ